MLCSLYMPGAPEALNGRPPIRFGLFEVDVASGELRKQGVKVKLQEQPFQVLIALLERPGDVLSRDDLQKRLWPSDVVVDFERGLNKAISRLREALDDNAENPRLIETLPQRGYRFLGEIESPAAPPAPRPVAPMAPLLPGRRVLLAIVGVAFAGVLIAALALIRGYLRRSPERIESIAVLPLENLSGDAGQEYFSDGMTDELIGAIARISSLRVISRTSIMQYKRSARKSLPMIARELNVDAIVEGTIVQSGGKVRITAQLIRAADDRHLWSEQYERNLADILTLQGEVARAIANQIQTKLTPEQNARVTRRQQVNPLAYDLYLKGNFFVHQGVRGTGKSIQFFQQALALDPAYAAAYAGLAEAWCFSAIFGLRPSGEAYPEARAAALRALELDESSASAHNALAEVKQSYDWDLAGAEVEFKRALALSPSDTLVRLRYAESLTRMRRFDEAELESAKTLKLDPVSSLSYVGRAMILFRARRYDEAIRASQQAIDLDPSNVNALWWQGVAYAGKNDYPKSIAALTKALQMADGPLFRGYLGFVYGRAGEKTKALEILNELATLSKQRFVSPVDYALVYAGLGDAEATFALLEKAYQAHETRFELASLYFDNFRSDPRFPDLMRRVGLPVQAP